jgi:hypothetical protein
VSESGGTAGPNAESDFVGSAMALLNAALGVGAAFTKMAAIATAGGQTVPKPLVDAPPISVLIHYSLAVATNVLTLVVEPLKGTGAGADVAASPPRAASAARPSVPPGATLRIPLSIENPSTTPMSGLAPLVRAIQRNGQDASADLPLSALSFKPAMLDIGPKDFEKLTVAIAVPDDAPAGSYELTLALGPKQPDLSLALDVTERSIRD